MVITGTNFNNATTVWFGGVAAASFSVTSSTSITAVVPEHVAGTVDVAVDTPSGGSPANNFDKFTFNAAPPTVTAVSPGGGVTTGETPVTITGTNFVGATAVLFGQTPALAFAVVSPTTITATAPVEPAGTVDVTVATAGGSSLTSAADQFAFQAAGPTNLQISPTPANLQLGQAVSLSAIFIDLSPNPSVADTWTVAGPSAASATSTPTIVSGAGTDQFQFTPTQAGTYNVSLSVVDQNAGGASDTATTTVVVGAGSGSGNGGSAGPANVPVSGLNVALSLPSNTLIAGAFEPLTATITDVDPNATVTDTWTYTYFSGITRSLTTDPTGSGGSYTDVVPVGMSDPGIVTVTLNTTDSDGRTASATTAVDLTESVTPLVLTASSGSILPGQSTVLNAEYLVNPGVAVTDTWTIFGPNGTTTFVDSPTLSGAIATDQYQLTAPQLNAVLPNEYYEEVGLVVSVSGSAFMQASAVINIVPPPAASISVTTASTYVAGTSSSTIASAPLFSTVGLGANLTGDFGTNPTEQWTITTPGGTVTQSQGLATGFRASATGNYMAKLTVTAPNGQILAASTATIGVYAPTTATVLNPSISVSPQTPIYQGQAVTLTANYDPSKPWWDGVTGGSATNSTGPFTYQWTVLDASRNPVQGQTNSNGSFTFTPPRSGDYTAQVTITGPRTNVTSVPTGFTALPPILVASGSALFAIKGQQVSGVVARFSESFPGPSNGATLTAPAYSALINWGDGETSTGQVDSGNGTVSGAHTYEQGGPFVVTVEIVDSAHKIPYSVWNGVNNVPKSGSLIAFAASVVQVFGPDEDQLADAMNAEQLSASGSAWLTPPTAGSSGTQSADGIGQNGTFNFTGGAGGNFTFDYGYDEQNGSVVVAETGSLSVSFQASGTYDQGASDGPSFEIGDYNVVANVQMQDTRQETYTDSFLSINRTDTNTASVADTREVGATYDSRQVQEVEIGTETANGMIFADYPDSNDIVPGEANEFLQKLDDDGIGGPFSYSGQDGQTLSISETQNDLTGQSTSFSLSDSALQAVQTGSNQANSYTQTIANVGSEEVSEATTPSANETVSEWNFNQSSVHRVATDQTQAVVTDEFTSEMGGSQKASDGSGDYSQTRSYYTETSGTTAETNQTDRNVENSFSNSITNSQQTGNSQSGIFGSFQTTATQSIVNTVDTNLTSTVSAAETSTGNTTEIRTGNNNSGDYAGAVFGLTTTSSEETDSNQTQLAMSDGNSVELDTESSGGNNNSGTYFRNSSSQVVSNDATVENILTDTVAALSSSTSDDSEFKSGNSITGAYTLTDYGSGSETADEIETNQTLTASTHETSTNFSTAQESGNDIYQTVSVSETSGGSDTSTALETNQTDTVSSSETDGDNRTVTQTENSITGIYGLYEFDSSSSTVASTVSNQTLVATTNETSGDQATTTDIGNEILGPGLSTETDTDSDTIISIETNGVSLPSQWGTNTTVTQTDSSSETDGDSSTVITTDNSITGFYSTIETDSGNSTVDETETNSQNALFFVTTHETSGDQTTTNDTGNEITGDDTSTETATGTTTTTTVETNGVSLTSQDGTTTTVTQTDSSSETDGDSSTVITTDNSITGFYSTIETDSGTSTADETETTRRNVLFGQHA